jgi:hypothetical protein
VGLLPFCYSHSLIIKSTHWDDSTGRIIGFIDWIKQLFTSQSRSTFPSEKERKRRDDEEEEEIKELVALDII